ncbi:hypothetical protein Are01nite_19460 [Actinoplanes regularis]|nr:hypothetical protein Are01nite_19460 [Actinoplanes regularis]
MFDAAIEEELMRGRDQRFAPSLSYAHGSADHPSAAAPRRHGALQGALHWVLPPDGDVGADSAVLYEPGGADPG